MVVAQTLWMLIRLLAIGVYDFVLASVWIVLRPKALMYDVHWSLRRDGEWVGAVVCGHAERYGRSVYVFHKFLSIDGEPQDGATKLRLDDRGVTWCLGWEGQEADAFKAARTLLDRSSS